MRNSSATKSMRAFWDDRAKENALWFIDSSLVYDSPDVAAFWRSGERALAESLGLFGLRLIGNERVLEIGCGIGRITRALAAASGEVVGIDVSDEMIRRGTQALTDVKNVRLQLSSGIDLSEFEDNSFDVGYSFVTFQHIPDPEITCTYISELGRVVRPGGWVLFQVSQHPDYHRREYWGRLRLRARISERLGRQPRGRMEPQWLGSAVSQERLNNALAKGNLDLEGIAGEGTLFCFVLARARVGGKPDAPVE